MSTEPVTGVVTRPGTSTHEPVTEPASSTLLMRGRQSLNNMMQVTNLS